MIKNKLNIEQTKSIFAKYGYNSCDKYQPIENLKQKSISIQKQILAADYACEQKTGKEPKHKLLNESLLQDILDFMTEHGKLSQILFELNDKSRGLKVIYNNLLSKVIYQKFNCNVYRAIEAYFYAREENSLPVQIALSDDDIVSNGYVEIANLSDIVILSKIGW